jgi:anaerobic ribonucleoside-triphosphate reductase activating protein
MKIRIAGIVRNSYVDGPGIRYTIFAQGCPHHCEDCHNPHTHDFSGGKKTDVLQITKEIRSDPLLSGVTFSGGEPFAQLSMFTDLAEQISDYNIICYTGYTFEELYENPSTHTLLRLIDVLVDGRFEKNRKSFGLKFRGSTNQRVIDSKESLRLGKVVAIVW